MDEEELFDKNFLTLNFFLRSQKQYLWKADAEHHHKRMEKFFGYRFRPLPRFLDRKIKNRKNKIYFILNSSMFFFFIYYKCSKIPSHFFCFDDDDDVDLMCNYLY